jgi:hypothetical protein
MQNETKTSKSKTPLLFAGIFLVLAVAAFFLFRDKLQALFPQDGSAINQPAWEKKLSDLEKEIGAKPQADSMVETPFRQAEIQRPDNSTAGEAAKSSQQILREKLYAFFDHLDQQAYIQDYQLSEKSSAHFSRTINKLLANPPLVTREADDLFSILNNMAHFYRVLGRQEINLIKDVLDNAKPDIEEEMNLFYEWSEVEQPASGGDGDFVLPLPQMYEYAGFFLNTLGGQAYLFRRDSSIRLLVRYFSVLIVDRANSLNMNRHGIDIRHVIDSLIDEMEVSQALQRKNDYLTKLYSLQEQYQAKYK